MLAGMGNRVKPPWQDFLARPSPRPTRCDDAHMPRLQRKALATPGPSSSWSPRLKREPGGGATAAAELWQTYSHHAARIFGSGPSPTTVFGERSFFVASGAPHVDLNQAALYGDAGAADAIEIGRLAVKSDDPVLLARSAEVTAELEEPLEQAGFTRLPTAEHLFCMPGTPPRSGLAPFDVRRMTSPADVAAMQAMFADVHDYGPGLTGALFGTLDPADDGLSCWIAWDGNEAVSLAFVTHEPSTLGLWEVMTPQRHRRRGAARTVVVTALDEVAQLVGGVERSLFWSSPAGRPLYDSLGFEIADTVEVWVRGASEADLAAVGAG